MKKLSGFITVLLCVVMLLSGCENTKTEKEHITITVWTYYNGAQLTAFNELVEEFNRTVGMEKGITVVSSSQGSVNDLQNNVLDAVEGKIGASDVPNIFAAYADTAYAVDNMGLVADIRPYFTDEELSSYVDSYISEGSFDSDGSIKIFPIAKSTEIFLLNKTDWDIFANATGATYDDLSTMEKLTKTAENYYEWTDGLTPDIPNDGKALFGRDAMANYMLIGAKQFGIEMFEISDGKMKLNFDRDVVKKLWDNYYVPYIKGYFASSGRFRSDDTKTGNILCFVGSSSGATFFPEQVILSDTVSYPIEMEAFPSPRFERGNSVAVQQGAGMVVTNSNEQEVSASVEFLKWMTKNENNIAFSVNSGYMPVRKDANDYGAIEANMDGGISESMKRILTAALDTVNNCTLYTPNAFDGETSARNVLEYSMSDIAKADRAVVLERLHSGLSLEDASAEFVTDEYFDVWYNDTLDRLSAYASEVISE